MGSGATPRCVRCHGQRPEDGYRSEAEISAEIAAVCAAWSGLPGPNVRLTGAEPFGHPELPAIVSAAVSAGCDRLGVDTDAIGLRSAGNAAGALRAGVRNVRFTLLGGVPGLHDSLAAVPGALEATTEGVRAYAGIAKAEGVAVHVTALLPVCRHNAHDLPATVGVALECGADEVRLLFEDGGMELAQAVPWIVAACDTGVVNRVWVEVEGMPFCLLPGYDLHVADAVRPRPGAKPPTCRECALDAVCAGAPPCASADQLVELEPPAFASRLALSVRRARGSEAS